MKKTKRLIWASALMVVIASVVSLMFIAFSYADNTESTEAEAVSEQEVVAESNDSLTITLNVIGDADPSAYQIICQSGYYDSAKRIITLPNSVTSYDFKNQSVPDPKKVSAFYLQFTNPDTGKRESILVELKATSILSTIKKPWDTRKGPYTESKIVSSQVDKLDVKSATIKGAITTKEENAIAAGAEIKFGNRTTGEVYGSAIAETDGTYTMEDIDIDVINKLFSHEIIAFVYSTLPGYTIGTVGLANPEVKDEILVFNSANMELAKARISVVGSDHHQYFNIKTKQTSPDSSSANAVSETIFVLSSIGIGGYELPDEGIEFAIDEDGSFTGKFSPAASMEIEFSSEPVCDDGFTFDYVDVNGEKHYAGETITIEPEILYDAVMYYKPVAQNTEVTETAQTGDAIPFAVLIALGIVAGLSVVAIRKFSK